MDHVNSFRDLHVYKLARQLAKEIFDLQKFSTRGKVLSYRPDTKGIALGGRVDR